LLSNPTATTSDDNEKSGKIIHFEKIGSNFFWTPLPSHDNFAPNFLGRKFGPTKSRKGSTPDLEKLDPIFQNELFFPFSVNLKSMFSWSIRPDEHGKMVYFFLWSIPSATTTMAFSVVSEIIH
jgi:hypothetical protein